MLWRGKGHKSPGSGGLSEEVGAIFSPQESGEEAILGMVKMLGAHSFQRFRRLSSGGMKPKTIFARAGVWWEMRICIGIFLCISAFTVENTIRRSKKAESGNVVKFIQ